MPARRLLVLSVLPFAMFVCARTASSQTCPSARVTNFRSVNFTGTQWTLAWDPPAAAPAGTTYEFLQETGSGYCLP